MINLAGYRILMTYYYMSSFPMAQIEVWLYSPNRLIKLTDAFYLLEHKTKKSSLADLYTLYTPYLC